MAELAYPGFNSVPLGVSGSGSAFILQGGNAPLNTLMRQDAAAARAAQQQAALKQKEREQSFKVFQSAKFEGKPFLPWQNQLQGRAQGFYEEARQIAQDNTVDEYTKQTRVNQLRSKYDGSVNRSNEVEQQLNKVRQVVGTDKRYSEMATEEAFFKTFEDEAGNVVDIDTYDPKKLAGVLEDPRTFDRKKVATTFIDELTKRADASTNEVAARPGSTGRRNMAESNLWVVENGQFKLDPATGNRIPKTERPEFIEAVKRDPFLGKVIDMRMGEHQKQLDGILQKMQNLEPLTPEEQDVVSQEQSAPKRYQDFVTDELMVHAYGRQSSIQTYRAAPRPRAAAATVTTVVAGGPQTQADLGIQTENSQTGFRSLATFAQPFEDKKGEKKPIVMKQARFSNVTISVPGEKTQRYATLSEGQDLQLGQPHLFLTSKTGNIYNPLDINVRQDPKAYEEWAIKQMRAKPGTYHFAYHIEAHPDKGQNNIGGVGDIAGDISQSYNAPAAAPAAGSVPIPSFGGGSGRKSPSSVELRDKARRIQRNQNATYYVLYEGNNRAMIDGRTPGYKQQAQQMQAAAARLNALAKQGGAPAGTGGLYSRPAAQAPAKQKTTTANRGGAY